MWERQGRAVKPSELSTPAKEVRKRGSKEEEPAGSSLAAEEEAEVHSAALIAAACHCSKEAGMES